MLLVPRQALTTPSVKIALNNTTPLKELKPVPSVMTLSGLPQNPPLLLPVLTALLIGTLQMQNVYNVPMVKEPRQVPQLVLLALMEKSLTRPLETLELVLLVHLDSHLMAKPVLLNAKLDTTNPKIHVFYAPPDFSLLLVPLSVPPVQQELTKMEPA